MKYIKGILIVVSLFFLNNITLAQDPENIPSPLREARGVWVATVANIDWPSRPGLSVDDQKKEALIIIERVKDLNMNMIVLQIRPQADALYKSDLEPWSFYLTGTMGKAPEPFYDPLEFWIDECHIRGIELHAWFNPYRANHPAMRSEVHEKSILKTHPDYVRKLGEQGYYWMDPSIPGVQDHSYAVVMDVVKRYNVDGVQFDDYFYPYRDYNNGKDFPDSVTYTAYVSKGGKMLRDDWRRDAVNKFIKRVYEGIKKEKPLVKFGISPFGVYRPGSPANFTAGFDQYSTLYADAKLWLNEGWMDYYSPQLYWNISRLDLSYPLLLNWWNDENTKKRHMWPGLFIRPEVNERDMSLEIVNQIMITRGMVPEGPGTIIFSMQSLIPTDSLSSQRLKAGPYRTQALMPASPWLDSSAPDAPVITAEKADTMLNISWKHSGKEEPFLFVLYTKTNGRWDSEIYACKDVNAVKKAAGITEVAISAVDRCGNEGKKNIFVVK